MIPTTRHLQYANGYIDLGMVDEASDELEAIDWDDRMIPEVLAVRVDLYHAAKNWELMRDIASHLAESMPDQSDNWMHWAFALREISCRDRGIQHSMVIHRLTFAAALWSRPFSFPERYPRPTHSLAK